MDIANILTQAEIPVKLRCAICNKLAVEAFKLPCCDQNICGSCQSASTDVCAVCTHSPLDASTCTPNKALRLTVKAFVKSEERKRNRDVKPSVPVTHVEASKHEAVIDAPSARAAPGSAPVSTTEAHPTPSNDVNRPDDAPLSQDLVVTTVEQTADMPDAILEPPSNVDVVVAETTDNAVEAAQNGVEALPADVAGDADKETQDLDASNTVQTNQVGMDWTNPAFMMQMQNMQNMQGMPFGGFPNMMGMPFMNMGMMNPMQMSNMMNGFGGMNNDMNMNFGTGANGGYRGSQMPYGRDMQQSHFNNRNFDNRSRGTGFSQRGYGRGRGGSFSRGGQGYQNHDRSRSDWSGHDGMQSTGSRSRLASVTMNQQTANDVDHNDTDATHAQTEADGQADRSNDAEQNGQADTDMADGQGEYHEQNDNGHVMEMPPAPPINAPTGPKAMRAGLPNNGRYSRPGAVQADDNDRPDKYSRRSSRIDPKAGDDRDDRPSRSRERRHGSRDRSGSRSSRVRSGHGASKSRDMSPARSRSPVDDDANVRDRERRRTSVVDRDDNRDGQDSRRRSKSPRDRHSRRSDRDDAKRSERSRERRRDRSGERSKRRRDSRSVSPDQRSDDVRGSPHRKKRRRGGEGRSRHDKREDREERKDKTSAKLEPPSDDVGFRIRGTKSGSTRKDSEGFNPPSGPRKDRDRGERRETASRSHRNSIAAPDPYALEREARHNERMQREEQRRESATTGKRSRTEDNEGTIKIPTSPRGDKNRNDSGRSKKSRRMQYKYEDEDDGRHGSRAARVEKEREMARWK